MNYIRIFHTSPPTEEGGETLYFLDGTRSYGEMALVNLNHYPMYLFSLIEIQLSRGSLVLYILLLKRNPYSF